MTTETQEINQQIDLLHLPSDTKRLLDTVPDWPLYPNDLDYFILPDGELLRLGPDSFRLPNDHKGDSARYKYVKEKYPDAVPLIWIEWLAGESGGPGSLSINEAVVIISTGLKGQGKSLLLAWLLAKALAVDMPVWSNMGVKFYLVDRNHDLKLLQSQELDWQTLIILAEQYEYGAIGIDELKYYVSSRQSMAVRNRIVTTLVNQVRKRTLDFYGSVKFLRQIDLDLREEIDAEFACTDVARTIEGQESFMPKGCFIDWLSRDISGWSGHPIGRGNIVLRNGEKLDDLGEPIYANTGEHHDFDARFVWPIYDSYHVIPITDAFRKVKFDMEELVVTDKPRAEDTANELMLVIDKFRSEGNYMPECQEFRDACVNAGISISDNHMGKWLRPFEIERIRKAGKQYYNLENAI